MIPLRRFCLIRHGQTDANRDGLIAGTTDAQLTEAGREAARQVALLDWPAPLHIFVSPQGRATETAALIFPAASPVIVAGLRERDWGRFEGRPVTELPPRTSTPDGGEGWQAFLARVEAALIHCLDAAPEGLPVIVAHSGVIRAARMLTGGDFRGPSAPNTTPLIFTPYGEHWREALFFPPSDPAPNRPAR